MFSVGQALYSGLKASYQDATRPPVADQSLSGVPCDPNDLGSEVRAAARLWAERCGRDVGDFSRPTPLTSGATSLSGWCNRCQGCGRANKRRGAGKSYIWHGMWSDGVGESRTSPPNTGYVERGKAPPPPTRMVPGSIGTDVGTMAGLGNVWPILIIGVLIEARGRVGLMFCSVISLVSQRSARCLLADCATACSAPHWIRSGRLLALIRQAALSP